MGCKGFKKILFDPPEFCGATMLQKKYGSWRIGKRWRTNRKNSKNDEPEAIDGNNEPSTCRTSFLSDTSSGGHTECLSYGETASLSGSVLSEHNSNSNYLMSSSSSITTTATVDEQQQWEQQMKQQKRKHEK